MFKIRPYLKAPDQGGSDGGGGGGGGQGGASQGGALASAAAKAAAANGGVKIEDARSYLSNYAHDPQIVAGIKDEDVLTWHGRVRGNIDKATAEALAAARKAEGERPDWLPEQFWDPETKTTRRDALVKSWKDTSTELKKLKGDPPKGVPAKAEEYAYQRPGDLPAHIAADPDSEDVKVLRECAFECGLSQEQFAKFTTGYFQKAAALVGAPPDAKAELAKLGPNGEKVADTVYGWGKGLVAQGVLTEEEMNEIVIQGGTAVGLRALNKIRESMGGEQIPVTQTESSGLPSEQELYAMVASEKYQTDPAERARVDALFDKRFGTHAAGSSQSGLGMAGRRAA